MSRAIRRWAPRVAAAILAVGVGGGLILAVVAQRSVRQDSRGVGGSAGGISPQQLAASATPAATPTDPSHLSPAELYCLRVLGAEQEYRQAPAKRQGLQNTISSCVQYYNHPVVNSTAALLHPKTTPYVCDPQSFLHGRPLGAGELFDERVPYPMPYSFDSFWIWNDRGNAAVVYAGARREGRGLEDYSQGLVMVQDYQDYPCRGDHQGILVQSTDYPTPSRHGEIKIVDAVGETLKLQATDGTIFYFDVASRQYVAAFPAGAAAPATVPTPSPGP
jgi:hypothetical protein